MPSNMALILRLLKERISHLKFNQEDGWLSERLLGLADIGDLVKIMNTEQKAAKALFTWQCLD